MDIEQSAAESHVRLAILVLQARQKRLDNTTTKMSRHYSRLAHTKAALVLLDELAAMLRQDPDHWDDDQEVVPF